MYMMQQATGDVTSREKWFLEFMHTDPAVWFNRPLQDITQADLADWATGGGLIELGIDKNGNWVLIDER